MNRPSIGAFLLATLAVACGGGDKHARNAGKLNALATPLAAAFREEAIGDQGKAVGLYVRALELASNAEDDDGAVAVTLAALDALVLRDVAAFADMASSSALVDRLPEAALAKSGGTIEARLAKLQDEADGPFVKGLIANARLALAERRGDAKAAEALRAASGCAREASVIGPLSLLPVSGVAEPSPVGPADAVLPQEIPGPSPFSGKLVPQPVHALGCRLPLYASTSVDGVREVIVDVEVPEGGDIGLALRSSGTATLRAGGAIVLERPYSAGSGNVLRLARVHADKKGLLRLVARVGMDQDYATIELDAWDGSGKPLKMRAPQVGSRANITVTKHRTIGAGQPGSPEEILAVALGAMAARDPHAAESVIYPQLARTDTPPELLLAYGRAVRGAADLPMVQATERARSAYDRALEAWPNAWEAIAEHAVLAGVRRGRGEARIEMLSDLEKTRAKKAVASSALLDAFEAGTAGAEQLADRASAALDKARPKLGGSMLFRAAERLAFDRTGQEVVAFDCDEKAAADRTSLACYHARISVGDRAGAERELERLRALAGSGQFYLSLSERSALESGDLTRAAKILAAMNPGDRTLSNLYAAKGGQTSTSDLLAAARTARDAPAAIPGLLRASGDDPLKAWEGVAERVTADEKGGALLTNAATAVLAHEERYDVDATGLAHFTMLDVRRVMGTADVEANAQAGAPMFYGKDTLRILRRRIFKKDGRILLPDSTPNAAQSHADLSQLEAGDAVEAIYEGWAIPGSKGNIGIDTPDLLPERTAVRDARIELRLPEGVKGALWSHPMLGGAVEKIEGGKRVLTWTMKERGVRRIEYGVPKMDRNVGVSFSTTTWNDVGKGLRETIASLEASDPEVSRWAKDASGGKPISRALVEAVVEASGKTVKEASGMMLADIDLGGSGGQSVTARTMLATHEGSRTWLIVRALRELGVPTDIVVAENEPFSDTPGFPPHYGRFVHPLAVAHVPNAQKNNAIEDLWIDADIPGPPLPAGKISPELRGRFALYQDGRIAPLPQVSSKDERDEIDERLVVDEQGNGKGVLTVLLRGRSAQDLAEVLTRIVGAERQRALRGIALGWVPFATVEKVELSSSEGSWQIAIRAEFSAPAYAQVEGQKAGSRTWVLPGIDPIHYVFPRPYVTTLASTYASHAARENALAIGRATQYHVRRRVELPAKASIARLPGPFEGKGPLLEAQRKVQVDGQTIEEDFVLEVTTGTVPRDRYDAFVEEAHRVDDAFRASIRIKPPAP